MYFCEAAPATSRPASCRLRPACARRPVLLRVPRRHGPAITSSMTFLMAGSSGKLSAHGALQQPAGDDEAVDFVGAFEDAVDARVAIGALGRILFDEAVAAVDLHRLIDHAVEHLRAPDFDDGALDGVLLDGFADSLAAREFFVDLGQSGVHHADGAIDHRLAGVDARPPSARSSRGSGRSRRWSCRKPCAAWRRRWHSASEVRAPPTHHRAQLEAADVENVEGDDVAFADFAEHVLDRHLAVVQDERAGGRAANAHLVLFGADGESGESSSRRGTR